MPAYTTVPSVMPSGRGIYFPFPDKVTSLALPGETQSLTITSNPSAVSLSSLKITFNGQTTAPIPVSVIPPPVYFQWNPQIKSPGTYDLAVNLFIGGTSSLQMTYDVYDGNKKLKRVVFNCRNGAGLPTPTNDPSLVCYGNGTGNGGPVQWYPLGRFNFTGTNISVRASCPLPDIEGWTLTGNVNDLRITDTSGNVITRATTSIPPSFASPGFFPQNFSKQVYGDPSWLSFTGQGVDDRYAVDPSVVKAELEKLSSVGVGNIQCTGDGTLKTPLQVVFIKNLSNTSQNLLTCDHPSDVKIVRTVSGGSWPSIKINGGPAITSSHPYWLPSGKMSAIAFFFIPDMDDVRYQAVNTNSNTIFGPWSNYLDDLNGVSGGGYTSQMYRSEGSGATATFTEIPLTKGTYRVCATWPANAAWSNDVIFTLKNTAGTILSTHHVNQTLTPSGDGGGIWEIIGTTTITEEMGNGLVVVQSNNTGTSMIADTIRFERTSGRIETKINAGDSVTYTTKDGWVTTTNGPVAGVADKPLLNLVGKTLFPDLEASQTMGVGYNIAADNAITCDHIYANIMRSANPFEGAAVDSLGYPTAVSRYESFNQVVLPRVSYQADNKLWPGLLPGEYVLLWDGDTSTDVQLRSTGGTMRPVENVSKRVITGTKNNRKYYDYSSNGWGVDMGLAFRTLNPDTNGAGKIDARNVRIYNSSIDINNPPKYNPRFIERVSNKKVLRFMDFFFAIDGNSVNFEDYNRPQSSIGSGNWAVRTSAVSIAQIKQYTDSKYSSLSSVSNAVTYQVTTTTPHGLSNGQMISFRNYGGPDAQVKGSSGTTSMNFSQVMTHVIVLDSTNFIIAPGPIGYNTLTNGPFTNPGGYVYLEVKSGSLQDAVEICNLANADFYLNTVHTLSQDALTKIGAYISANLKPNLKVYHEPSNEPWNYFSSPFAWFSNGGIAFGYTGAGSDYVPYYCQVAKNHWQWVRDGMGSRVSDHVRTFGTQFTNSGITAAYAQYCLAQKPPIVFDAVAVAPYYHNTPSDQDGVTTDFSTMEGHLNIEQCLDLQEMFWINTSYQDQMKRHKDALVAGGLPANNTVKIVGYEGGPESAITEGNYSRFGERTHGMLRHPRYWTFMQNTFKIYQNTGLDFFTVYKLSGSDGQYQWPTYQGAEQLDYSPGSPAQDLIQIKDFHNLSLAGARSVVGGAVTSWSNRVNGAIPAQPSTNSSYDVILPVNSIVGIPTQIIIIFDQSLTKDITINISDGDVNGLANMKAGDIYAVIPYTPTTPGNKTLSVSHSDSSMTAPKDLAFLVLSNKLTMSIR